jgi:hypothetical protein
MSIRKLSTVGLLTVAATALLPVATANAAGTSGSCGASGYYANFALVYHNAGSYHYPDKFEWTLGKGQNSMGNRNNVEARVKTVNTGGDDPTHYTHISPDSVKPGAGSHNIPGSVSVAKSRSMYGAFRFVFDKPDDDDPRCTGRTASV